MIHQLRSNKRAYLSVEIVIIIIISTANYYIIKHSQN